MTPVEVRRLNISLKDSGLKYCNSCGETKALEGFAESRGGRAARCKACSNQKYVENREAVAGDRRRHYEDNRDQILSQKALYREENREDLREKAVVMRRSGGRDPEKSWPTGASYKAAHSRVLYVRGSATNYSCCGDDCGNQASGWAYNHQDPDERCESVYDRRRGVYRDCFYSEHHDFYRPMCTGCHIRFDSEMAQSRKAGLS
jgi:hypothetical protein